ncbi:ribonucleotide reductase [Aeromonas phage BUCT695]|uniref:ribonucleotide reductase n=1 Tax=Aeromonas phage BUCT695 TaxID=2908630 RepID=UPI002329317B|nr:ribonucleotide reductase [Aeromonas phage BUCT695]UIW10568.1 ribonucleotide reductase of class Ia (aerobic) beta subunit [Aeromonas phage BUCT695]
MIELYKNLPMYKEQEGWIIKYPKFAELADEQMHTFWPWDEPAVDNDVQDLRTRLTPGELNGITTVLKLFTIYERHVGEDYWSGRIARTFARPEIQRMASLFSAVESNSHAPFYNKVNEVLYLDNEEFYQSWKEVEQLRNRMEFVGRAIADEDDAKSFAAFTFIEGSVLYSSFAYLKHFQSQECGKDLMRNICRGVDLSVADEHTHSVGGALLFGTLCSEMQEMYGINVREHLKDSVIRMANEVYDHESGIIDLIFSEEIKGINKNQLRNFVKSRINLCLNNLGYASIFTIDDDTVEKWFYQSINGKKFHDFFTGSGSEYNINWDRMGFDVWSKK